MSSVSTYGGSCPHCSKPMHQEANSWGGGFQADACPWCGFAYALGLDTPDFKAGQVWPFIFNIYGMPVGSTLGDLRAKIGDAPGGREFHPTVIDHAKTSVKERMECLCFEFVYQGLPASVD